MTNKTAIRFLISMCLISIHGISLAQKVDNTKNEIILSELNFAELASKSSIKQAFEQNLDSTGVIVNGIKIVNGLKAYAAITSDNTARLVWYPTYASMNVDRDFGFTTGPYLFYANKGEKPDATGNYFSIWKKDKNNIFKLIFDGGINHTKIRNDYNIAINEASTKFTALKTEAKTSISTPPRLQTTDDAVPYLSSKVVTLRADQPVLFGKKQYQQPSAQMTYVQKISGYDKSGTIFYCIGNLSNNAQEALQNKFQGYYVQVWRFEKNWEIVADVIQLIK
ncbi:hypothetical protein [Pedobacter montanisoli]|uniref:DUF4440 domain-containing protein n=1 Tax=Pedobacter montanisoli TaxID=2923277 RepID=A0ABS9ZZ51_9SPHI|nr:hypothetical protein [Pedobacter montanisoli]MCJ0743579.1 hypothetical protein [Pedobacter montanisoli]